MANGTDLITPEYFYLSNRRFAQHNCECVHRPSCKASTYFIKLNAKYFVNPLDFGVGYLRQLGQCHDRWCPGDVMVLSI